MRVIVSVEAAPRGVYCGAIGFVTPAGDAVFNVAIRTALIDVETGCADYGVGGGITWDSTTTGEYEEALSKAAIWSSSPPFELLETMRLERGDYLRRERHVGRMCDSARHLASCGLFDCASPDQRAIDHMLDAHARAHPVETRRVRLLLASSGDVRVESTPFEPRVSDVAAVPVVLARTPIQRDDRFLHHKTTHRAVYDAHRAALGDAFDVLLWNEAREITEFTTGNVVVELDGARSTPPRACGLLAGVLRGELLDAGEICERVITIDDLARATRVWFINSLRGWIAVEVCRDVVSATRAR